MINFQFTFFPILVITAKVWIHIKDILIGLGGLEHLRATVSRIGFHVSSLLGIYKHALSWWYHSQYYQFDWYRFLEIFYMLFAFVLNLLCVWFRLLMCCPIMETHQLTFSTGKQLHEAPDRRLAITRGFIVMIITNQPLEPIGCCRVNDPRWDFYHFNIEQMEMV